MRFTLVRQPSVADKTININGPCGLAIEVDYDDVSHDVVKAASERMLQILNAGWQPSDTERCEAAYRGEEE